MLIRLQLPTSAPVAGALLSIWCDRPGFQTEDEIAAGVAIWLRSFAQQTWGSPRPTTT